MLNRFKTKLQARLEQANTPQLVWTGIFGAMALSVLITSVMSILFFGRVTHYYPFTGAVAAFLISLVVLPLLSYFVIRLKESKESLLREERFRIILDSVNDAISVHDLATGVILDVNRRFCEMLGLTPDEVRLLNLEQLACGEDASRLHEALQRIRESDHPGGQTIECQIKNRSGQTYWVETELRRATIRERQCLLVTLRDITARRQAERALRESEQRFSVFMEHLPAGVFIKSPDDRLLFANKHLADFFGWKDWSEKTTLELIPEVLAAQMLDIDRRTLREGRQVVDVTLVDSQGRTRAFETCEFPIHGDAGPTGLGGIALEITDRKAAEAALRLSEEKYRRFFEEDLSAAYISTPEGRFVACNPSFAHMLGFDTVREALGQDAISFYRAPEIRTEFLDAIRKDGKVKYCHKELIRRDGKTLHVMESAIGVFDERGELTEIQGYLVDETGLRQAEEQLRQAAKMEAVGRLAGGVAHDFNNILTVIQGYSDALPTELDDKEAMLEDIKEIDKATQRAAALTRQLLAFSRKQVIQPVTVDLNRVVEGIHRMLQRLIGEDIQLITNLAARLGKIMADPGQIEQVLMNLAVNSRDAMPHGGKIFIETAAVELGPQDAHLSPVVSPGPYILLQVRDTGVGMDETTVAHMFEPFFTTKKLGMGTGLGLAAVYGIVKQSNGYISVQSEPGRGTEVKIYLPVVEDTVVRAPEPATAACAIRRGSETILLIEDESSLRRLARRFLERCGYKVLESGDPQDALSVARQHEGPIHLLITDVVMPEMSGSHVARSLASFRPATRILYMSGYTDDEMVLHGVQSSELDFIQKPFTFPALAKKVREVLDKPA